MNDSKDRPTLYKIDMIPMTKTHLKYHGNKLKRNNQNILEKKTFEQNNYTFEKVVAKAINCAKTFYLLADTVVFSKHNSICPAMFLVLRSILL